MLEIICSYFNPLFNKTEQLKNQAEWEKYNIEEKAEKKGTFLLPKDHSFSLCDPLNDFEKHNSTKAQ